MAEELAKAGIEDFNWDELEHHKIRKEKENAKQEGPKDPMDEQYGNTLKQIADQEVIEGTVVSKNNREVVVNIGYKSDGIIPVSEFRYNPDLKPGDKVEVYVESQEDATGQLVLSHKKARILKSWERVNEAYDNSEIITGYVKSRTKGGLIVDVFGLEAFLPGFIIFSPLYGFGTFFLAYPINEIKDILEMIIECHAVDAAGFRNISNRDFRQRLLCHNTFQRHSHCPFCCLRHCYLTPYVKYSMIYKV